jgi:transcription-repair coupling factor (superfamily II helicase)
MVGEAVAEYKAMGEGKEPPPAEVRVELPVDAHIPHDYIPGERLRLEAYKRIADVGSVVGRDPEADIAAVRDELTDRYGPVPVEVENLLAVARFRAHLRAAGIEEATLAGPNVRFSPVKLRESQQMRLERLYPRTIVKTAANTILVPRPTTAKVGGTPIGGLELLDWARQVVDVVVGDVKQQGASA